MGPPVTPRLLAAAAALMPADRALVDLWVHRGLDDARLSALTGLDAEAVAVRRERIIEVLARELAVPEADVRAALPGAPPGPDGRRDVSTTPGSLHTPATVSSTGPPPAPVQAAPVTLPASGLTPDPSAATIPIQATSPGAEHQPRSEPEVSADESSAGRRRGRVWAGGLAALAIAVAAALIVVLSGAHRSTSRPAADRSATTAPTQASTTASADPSSTTTADPTATSTTTPTTSTPPGAFAGLPGGLRDAGGQVSLFGRGAHLRLRLTVRGLPAPGAGAHYEAWLYTSVLDSRPLGRVRDGRAETFRLPRGAGRYRFIDVSRQPRGAVNHSGESRLRTVNPVHDLRVHPHHPGRVRRHRSLHPAPGARGHHPRTGRRHGAHRRSGRRGSRDHSEPRGSRDHSEPRGSRGHSGRRGSRRSAARDHHHRRHRRPHRRRHHGRGSDSRTRRTR